MNYITAIKTAREHLHKSGMIELSGSKMIPLMQQTSEEQIEAEEIAETYNALARLHNALHNGDIAQVKRVEQ